MTGSTAFCTYFDSRYLSRGLVLHRSLCLHAPWARLYALCLDERAFEALNRLALPALEAIRLRDVEASDPDLQKAKCDRSQVEYYFTCTPALPLYVLRQNPTLERVLYIDADLCFFSSAEAVLRDWGAGSVYIVSHRYPEGPTHDQQFGRFNVGIVGFRNDREGRRCLDDWRNNCNAWCYDRVEDGKFADQKYLDRWPETYGGVVVGRHPGVNVAPWNWRQYRLTVRDGVPHVNGHPLVCYHFHGLKHYGFGLVQPSEVGYGRLTGEWIRAIYGPYLRQLALAEQQAGAGPLSELRARKRLSLLDISTNRQLLVQIGQRYAEISPALTEPLRLARRGAARLRNVLRRVKCAAPHLIA